MKINKELAKRVAKSGVITNIYGLVDPRDPGNVRYIGKANDIEARLKGHIGDCGKGKFYKSKKNNWIRGLLKQNIKPEAIHIAYVKMKDWKESEIFYIKLYFEKGFKLLNGNEGGTGCSYLTKEQRIELAESQKGEGNPFYNKKHKEETKDSIKRNLKAFFETEEGIKQRRQISQRKTGKIPWNKGLKLEGEKYKSGKKNKGKTRTDEVKAEMTRTRTGRKGFPHTEESRANISKSKTGVTLNLSTKVRNNLKDRMSGQNNPMSRSNIEKRNYKL